MMTATGFWGKLPSRGDFVRAGLSRAFTDPWDIWMSASLSDTRERLGVGWQAAWMEAPVWRFALSADLCGAAAVIGLWMPSVDRVGRHFPLTLAAEVPDGTAAHLAAAGGAWLDVAERAARAALEDVCSPQDLMANLPAFFTTQADEPFDAASLWWTEGAPRVDAQHFSLATMPGQDQFFRMLAGAEP